MELITDTATLAAFAARQATADYIAIDTEFMRESTYWPKLCLVQIAGPAEAVAIDPLAPGIDLAPLFELLQNPAVLKVFHSGRQDIEIFFHLTGQLPTPVFDTQIAAMVCGFGDQVAYEQLVAKLADARLDKSSRFTDWSQRPLTERQLRYALADVIHLRPAYEKLRERLTRSGRDAWLVEEMAVLGNPATYQVEPREAWRRLKTRSNDPRFLGVLRELAAWREIEAQRRDVPRGRILRDETLLEIASHAPRDAAELARTRGLSRSMAEGWQGQGILAAVERGLALPRSELPKPEARRVLPNGIGPTIELLKVLLKLTSEEHEVAQRLVASASDLELIAADDEADVPALHGWRREIFGRHALALKQGRTALAIRDRQVKLIELD